MKTSIYIISILSLINAAQAKCNSNVIGIYKESGFNNSCGGSKNSANNHDKNVKNVQLTVNGQQACFKKVSSFEMKRLKIKQ
jgi:hypothetical protein